MAIARALGAAARFRTWAPATGFLGGFAWDAATLGRSIKPLDLLLLLGYWAGAALLLLWLARRPATPANPPALPASRWAALREQASRHGPYFSLQFLFGGLFSALVIFYFKSAGTWPAFLLVLALAVLLVLNEFLDSHYHRFTLTWTLFGLCGIFFLNFSLPHLFKSIHPAWFYASTLLALAVTWVLHRSSPASSGKLWPLLGAAALLVALFAAKAIPPVPLVLKGIAVGRGLEKNSAGYSVRIERPPPWTPFRRSEKKVRPNGEPLYCLTSVFLPEGLAPRLYHRWALWNPAAKRWRTTDRIGFSARGGRQEGFRGYSVKKALPAGSWRVAVESEDGRELGFTAFQVLPAESGLPDTAAGAWVRVTLP